MKDWISTIDQHIDHWSQRLGSLSWWPKYVYHFTDIRNAVSILENGYLYSRDEAIRQGIMKVDNASQDVISNTDCNHFRFVRMYFRPKTPTLYCNEGIRPINQRVLNAHCGVPIYFCFDSKEILSRDDTNFSDGNMGRSGVQFGNDQNLFRNIPFDLVFHDAPISATENKDSIKFHRHAEVLIPGRLKLDKALRLILCRTSAERQSLMSMLSGPQLRKWENQIKIGTTLGLYNRKWTFVEEVVTVDDLITFRFNPNTITPGPFDAKFIYQEENEKSQRVWSGKLGKCNDKFSVKLKGASSGIASLDLDDARAFYGRVIFNDLPF